MTRFASWSATFALGLGILGAAASCENASRLDPIAKQGAASTAHGDTEARLAALEKKLAGVDGDALQFLQNAYEQNDPSAKEADPNARFAVDISQNLANGQVEGAVGAPITIVEAWDFA